MKRATFALGLSILLSVLPALAQSNAAEEAQHRAEVLRSLPQNAARRLFSIPAGLA